VQKCSVKELLSSLCESTEAMVSSYKGNLSVCASVDVYVVCNRDLLVSALSNLVHNALQAGANESSGAKIVISAALSPCRNVIQISISDNGPGILPTALDKIFEPFFTTKANGTGLGLAVVKAVVQAHHGTISINSQLGSGTAFHIALPFERVVNLSNRRDSRHA
jgi:two-component system, sensor histidine kinase FlrB